MEDFLSRVIESFLGRVDGPMKLRMVLQPLMAVIFAVRDGHRDAHQRKPPYGWALFTNPEHRHEMIKDGWKSIGKVFIIACVIDAIYQVIITRWIHPVQALTIAVVLAIVPYLLIRGPINRMFRAISGR